MSTTKDVDVETWENVSPGKVMVNRFTGMGHEERQDAIVPGRTVLISTQERQKLNSERCYAETADPFSNGILRPVSLATTSEDLEENPNHMSESGMASAFKVRNYPKFKSDIGKISSRTLLQRMLDLAVENPEDEGSVDATAGQVSALRERLEALSEVKVSELTQTGITAAIGDRGGF